LAAVSRPELRQPPRLDSVSENKKLENNKKQEAVTSKQ